MPCVHEHNVPQSSQIHKLILLAHHYAGIGRLTGGVRLRYSVGFGVCGLMDRVR